MRIANGDCTWVNGYFDASISMTFSEANETYFGGSFTGFTLPVPITVRVYEHGALLGFTFWNGDEPLMFIRRAEGRAMAVIAAREYFKVNAHLRTGFAESLFALTGNDLSQRHSLKVFDAVRGVDERQVNRERRLIELIATTIQNIFARTPTPWITNQVRAAMARKFLTEG